MAEDGYLSSAWETDHPDALQANGGHGRPQLRTFETMDSPLEPSASPNIQSISPIPRSSTDFSGRSASISRWPLESSPSIASSERRDVVGTSQSDMPTLVDTSFDESVLRQLCELDCGTPLLLDRIKQSTASCKEASAFFKKRAVIEEEYGRNMQKLSRATADQYSLGEGKAGTFVNAWQGTMRVHEMMAENRLRFSQRLNEMSEELSVLVKEVEKNRKQTKDLATRYERALQESEATTEKNKNRLDITSEELERVLLQKEGESLKDNAVQQRPAGTSGGGKRVLGKAVAKGGMLLKGKNPGNIQRQEDDIRLRVSTASDNYRKAMMDTQTMRQEYFNFQLPRILRALKECTDEMDLGTQYHLTRYAFLYESIVLSDGSILVPPREEGLGLKASIETIDNRGDFKVFMQHYAYARGPQARGPQARGLRRDGPVEEGFLPPIPTHAGLESRSLNITSNNGTASGSSQTLDRTTFGVDLAEQMSRDNVEVPPIMEKCCQAIEKHGMNTQGIYRISGTKNKVAKLKQMLDRDLDSVDLDAPEWSGDEIHNVTSVLKMWLRDLPDPLLTTSLHHGFLESARIENDRLRHIRLHERVNELPDPNYATLKYFLGHLYRIHTNSSVNSMTMQNLAIVFGPTLFGASPPTQGQQGQANGTMADSLVQNQAIETILNRYMDIFVDESEHSQQS